MLCADAHGTPQRWLLVFRRRADVWWVNYCPGEFKHVSAFGYVHEADAWIFYDAGLCTTIYVARGTSARAMMLQRTRGDVCVLSMEPLPCPSSPRRPIFTCTAAIANLLAIPTIALRPDALYRACIRHGAKIVSDGQAADADRAGDRPAAPGRSRPGEPGSDERASDPGAG